MRVALVVTGGVDESARHRVIPLLLSFIERMAARHELFVYALRYHQQPRSYPLLGATVRDLGRPTGIRRQYAALVRALRHDGPFDVVHGHWALPAGLTASLAGRRLGVPSIVSLASGEFVAAPDIAYGLQLKRRQRLAVAATLRLASRLTVASHYMRDLARAHAADPVVIPIGVDCRRFTPASAPPDTPMRLLHAASLNPVKDQATLLEAFRFARDRIPAIALDIAGEDTLDGAIQAHAARLGIDRHVTFHGGVSSDELVALYRRSHLFVMSSRHEAGGAVALEAAACGVPIVGTAVGYLADWAADRVLAVPPRDPRALGEAIVSALTDREGSMQRAAAARQWVCSHDADWTADRFDRLYHDVAGA